jgi:hypothetical protein
LAVRLLDPSTHIRLALSLPGDYLDDSQAERLILRRYYYKRAPRPNSYTGFRRMLQFIPIDSACPGGRGQITSPLLDHARRVVPKTNRPRPTTPTCCVCRSLPCHATLLRTRTRISEKLGQPLPTMLRLYQNSLGLSMIILHKRTQTICWAPPLPSPYLAPALCTPVGQAGTALDKTTEICYNLVNRT